MASVTLQDSIEAYVSGFLPFAHNNIRAINMKNMNGD
jgi:hypothetical protein